MLLELQHRESALGAHTLQIDYFATHGKGKGLLSKVHNGAFPPHDGGASWYVE